MGQFLEMRQLSVIMRDLCRASLGVSAQSMDLLTACKKNQVARAMELLSSGSDPEFQNRLGESPLHWAAIHSSAELVRALLAAGASPRVETRSKNAVGNGCSGATPLHFAASRSNLETVEVLLAAGADARATDSAGCTVLNGSVRNADVAIIRALVRNGADPNDGSLSLAVRDSSADVVRELLRLGASPDGAPGWFHPLRMAYAFNKREAIDLLVAAGAAWPQAEQS